MQIDLTLRAVTPTFLGSHKPDVIEARTAPIRGAMRYWLRALVGGVIGTQDIRRLQGIEESVFGSTRGNSPVTLRLLEAPTRELSEYSLLPHKIGNHQYAMRKAFLHDTFKLRLAGRPLVANDYLELAVWSAVVWTTLGGVGCRSRRAAGSLRVESLRVESAETSEDTGLSPDLLSVLRQIARKHDNPDSLASMVHDVIVRARQAFTRHIRLPAPADPEESPKYPVLSSRSLVKLWCPIKSNSPEDAMASLMKQMSLTKARLGDQYSRSFGGIKPRKASPLHVTVHELTSGPALVLTYMDVQNPHVSELFDQLQESWSIQLESK